jgi:hypothetical protein
MSISPISSSAPVYQPAQQDDTQQAFQQLASAISSGDASAAKQAFDTLAQAQQASGKTPDPNSPFAKALSQIGSALGSGNISDAQQALNTLQSHGRGGHHGHHRGGGRSEPGSSAAGTTTNLVGNTQTSTGAVNITA